MTDTEWLNLIEAYEWDILCYNNKAKPWKIFGKFGSTDYYKTLREAFEAGYNAQVKWSIGG
jgi:hypothetical protein